MKKAVFIASHLCSGSTPFLQVLADNPRIQCYRLNRVYSHPDSLANLTERSHKCTNRAAIWVDEILYNHQITSKALIGMCRWVYIIRDPKATMEALLKNNHFDPAPAVNYYCYRLRRLAEIARRTPGAVFLTWQDLLNGKGLPLVEEYLQLKQPLKMVPGIFLDGMGKNDVLTKDQFERCERAYERYLGLFRQMGLRHTD